MTITQQKDELRKIFKSKRAALSSQEVAVRSQQINHNFIANLLPKIDLVNPKKIFSLYLSSYNEVRSELIAQYFYQSNINFSYPRITQKNHHLDFIAATKNQEFKPNPFFHKILEPQGNIMVFPDVLILPLLAFDSSLSRLGMGGGFFDRSIEFLKNHNSKIITIGLAYDFQRSEAMLPNENTDRKLDFIVTEKTIFLAS